MANLTDTVISFASLVATSTLPPPLGSVVTAAIPAIADMVLGPDDLAAVFKTGSLSTIVTTQYGQSFEISVTQIPPVLDALKRAHERASAGGSGAVTRNQEFHGFSVSKGDDGTTAAGGVNILNGVIGIQW